MALPIYVVELSFGASGWIDVSGYVQNVSISRGINRILEDYSAGSLTIDFVNNDRVFDPLNTSSPLYDSVHGYTIVQPAGKVRVTANGIRKFTGFVRDWSFTYDVAGFDGKAHMQALDAIFYYGQATLTGGNAWQVESTDKRMSSVVYYNYGDLSRIAGVQAGQTLLGTDVWTAGDSVLSYLQQVARSEPADFYSNSSAVMVMKDRSFADYQWSNTMRYNFVSYPGTALSASDAFNGWWPTIGTKPTNPAALGRARAFGTGYAWMGGTVDAIDPADDFVGFEYQDLNLNRYQFNGSSWVFSAYGLGVINYELRAFLLDPSGNIVASSYSYATAASSATWTQCSGTVTYTGGTIAGVSLTFGYFGSTAVNVWGDGFIVEPGSAYINYFDGEYNPGTDTATSRNRVAWAGEAYASTSGFLSATATATTPASVLTFADSNSQGASYGNGTAIPFMDLQVVYGAENLYNKVQVIGVNATAIVEDTTSQSLYGLYSYSQTDNLTTSPARPNEIATQLLGEWRRPEYRAQQITIALEALTASQQNLVLGVELRDVIRVCFQPSATGTIVDKYYQVLGVDASTDTERDHITFRLSSLDNLPFRVDSTLLGILDTDILA